MSSNIPIVVSLEYIKSLEKTIRSLTFNLQGVNCNNTNLGLSDDIDCAISHLELVTKSLSKITSDPSRFTPTRA
jgi:hypothetical protein